MAVLRIPTVPSTVSTLLLILAIYFSHQPFMFVRATTDLIHQACHNAEVPETCLQCVESDTRSDNANTNVDIADIVVGCVTTQANYLQGNFTSMASSTKDHVTKEVFEHCVQWFSKAKNVLYAATLGLKGASYDSADRAVYGSVLHLLACNGEIHQLKDQYLLPEVKFGFSMYEELAEAAMRIINRL